MSALLGPRPRKGAERFPAAGPGVCEIISPKEGPNLEKQAKRSSVEGFRMDEFRLRSASTQDLEVSGVGKFGLAAMFRV